MRLNAQLLVPVSQIVMRTPRIRCVSDGYKDFLMDNNDFEVSILVDDTHGLSSIELWCIRLKKSFNTFSYYTGKKY